MRLLLLLLALISLLGSKHAHAQGANAEKPKRKMTCQQLADYVLNYKGDTCIVENVEVIDWPEKNNPFRGKTIKSNLVIDKCTFNVEVWFNSIHFEKLFAISDCIFSNRYFRPSILVIDSCVVDSLFLFQGNSVGDALVIQGCDLNKLIIGTYFKINNIRILQISKSIIRFKGGQIKFGSKRTGGISLNNGIELNIQTESVIVYKTTFSGPISISAKPKDITFSDVIFESSLGLYGSSNEQIQMKNVKVKHFLVNNSISFGVNCKLPFSTFAGKLSLSKYIKGKDKYFYIRDSLKLLKPDSLVKYSFDLLVISSFYSNLLANYRHNGDQESANACLVEFRDLQTILSEKKYQAHPTIEAYIEWRINWLLKYISAYGTDPAKAILWAFYIMLCFTGVYMLLPSEEDNLHRHRLTRYMRGVLVYLNGNRSLVLSQRRQQAKELLKLQQLSQQVRRDAPQIPWMIRWLVLRYVGLLNSTTRLYLLVAKRFDVSPKAWRSYGRRRQFLIGLSVSFTLLGFLLVGLFMRFLNALTLSLNAFVTLGYGEVQARGIARYLCVLEGVIGWFLLTVFTATLISQFLQ